MVPSDRSLSDLAESVAEEFEADRDSNGFNELSIVIDNRNPERPTLIVHIDREQAADLADRVQLAGEAIREDGTTQNSTAISPCGRPRACCRHSDSSVRRSSDI